MRFEKADPSIRNTVWECAGWNFYVDNQGDVHTSFGSPWSEEYLNGPGETTHNHWLENGGTSLGPEGVLIRECNPSLENK